MDITDFNPYEIAGFTLTGWKDSKGKIDIGDQVIDEFPNCITCNDVLYTLEEITESEHDSQGRVFCNAEYV